MTYDTIDWDAEAKRLAKVFGIEGECYFRAHIRPKGSKRLCLVGSKSKNINVGMDSLLSVTYDTNGRYFHLDDWPQDNQLSLKMGWDRNDVAFNSEGNCDEISLLLARALFDLEFLTPEVEAKLQITISHHQKLEWSLESK